jgi:hypothetical protein
MAEKRDHRPVRRVNEKVLDVMGDSTDDDITYKSIFVP